MAKTGTSWAREVPTADLDLRQLLDVEAEFHPITLLCSNAYVAAPPKRAAMYLRISLDATGERLANSESAVAEEIIHVA
jgi:hypothetical protein